MANTVYTVEEIELQDGKKVVLKPLTIKKLREFGPMLKEFLELENEEEDVYLDHMVKMAAFCVSRQHPKYMEDEDARDDAFDLETVYHIIEVCTGARLKADPEAVERLLRQAQESQEPGKTS